MLQCTDDDKPDETADDRSRNEKALENGKKRPDRHSCCQKNADGAKGHDGSHGKLSCRVCRETWLPAENTIAGDAALHG